VLVKRHEKRTFVSEIQILEIYSAHGLQRAIEGGILSVKPTFNPQKECYWGGSLKLEPNHTIR